MARLCILGGLLAVVTVSAACRQEPEDRFFFTGRVVDATMQPRPSARFRVRSDPSGRCELPSEDALAFASPDAPRPVVAEGQSDESGRYLLELYRFQVEPLTFGQASCLRLALDGPEGASSELSFRGTARAMELPDLVRWDEGRPTATLQEGASLVSMPQVPWAKLHRLGDPSPPLSNDDEPREPLTFAEWQVVAGGGVAWREWASGAPQLLLGEVLEDFDSPRVRLEIATLGEIVTRPVGATSVLRENYVSRVRSPVVELAETGLVPTSRGAECTTGGQHLQPCPFTDGTLEEVEVHPVLLPQGRLVISEVVQVVLPTAVVPRTLVARGVVQGESAQGVLRVDGSIDGTTWVPLGQETSVTFSLGVARFVLIPLDSKGSPIRFVRVAAQARVAAMQLSEVSIFE